MGQDSGQLGDAERMKYKEGSGKVSAFLLRSRGTLSGGLNPCAPTSACRCVANEWTRFTSLIHSLSRFVAAQKPACPTLTMFELRKRIRSIPFADSLAGSQLSRRYAAPPGVGPFHFVSSFIVVGNLFDLFNIDSGSVSDLIVFVSLDRGATIVRLNPSIRIYVSLAASWEVIPPLAGNKI